MTASAAMSDLGDRRYLLFCPLPSSMASVFFHVNCGIADKINPCHQNPFLVLPPLLASLLWLASLLFVAFMLLVTFCCLWDSDVVDIPSVPFVSTIIFVHSVDGVPAVADVPSALAFMLLLHSVVAGILLASLLLMPFLYAQY
jgi:hypothetical protein